VLALSYLCNRFVVVVLLFASPSSQKVLSKIILYVINAGSKKR
jgi:hypothetical protein